MMRVMVNSASELKRVGAYIPQKLLIFTLLFMLVSTITFFTIFESNVHLSSEDKMEERIVEMHSHLQFLKSQYRGRQEDVMSLQAKVLTERGNETPRRKNDTPIFSTEVMALLKTMSGNTKSAAGVYTKTVSELKMPFVFQLLPHLMNDPDSLKPAFHLRSPKLYADIVIGIPTVKRDQDSYIIETLSHLLSGMDESDRNTTLIVVMVGETDLEYVLITAKRIEEKFPEQVGDGHLEVISPSAAYYPDLETVPTSLGDSNKRVKWRTKQNLDTIYLMSYCQSRGTMYLMLEDDVIAKDGYMKEIRKFTAATSVKNPNWVFIEYCHVGGIGKLFKSPDLVHFIIYVQLFYTRMPIDWLLESYLADRVCSNNKSSKLCAESKIKIRPKYKTSLFQHIGLYSSLKGKIQKVKESRYGHLTSYFPHNNPPIKTILSDIADRGEHTVKNAYEGKTYFWGVKPKKGDKIEFWFERPTAIKSYILRSGNAEHVSDKFYETNVEILPYFSHSYSVVGTFDEFGLAEGAIDKELGPLSAIRLRVNKDSNYWVILSEIEFRPLVGRNQSQYKITIPKNMFFKGMRRRLARQNITMSKADCEKYADNPLAPC